MTQKAQTRLKVFLLLFGAFLLVLALALNRWYAFVPGLLFLVWLIRIFIRKE